jgi:hypothetical protein
MHAIPPSSTALDSLHSDGDLSLRRVWEQGPADLSETTPQPESTIKASPKASDNDTESKSLLRSIACNVDDLDKLNCLHTRPKYTKPEAAQCILLCMRGDHGDNLAVEVPCYRPTVARQVRPGRTILATRETRISYHEIKHEETVCESDSLIYLRLRETCFDYYGNWKRWIPFYGITDVQEVMVRLLDLEFERR